MAGSYGSTDDKSMDLLHESIRVNEESQLVGTATMGQLKDQREQLERARDQVGETGDRAREARSAMNQIADNIFREKVGLWFTIAVVFTIDVLLAYRLGTNKGRLFR